MGWDACSSAKQAGSTRKLIDPDIDKLFRNADAFVKRKAEFADAGLRIGYLDCSECAHMLERATGKGAWGDGWSVEQVQQINKEANWDFKFIKEDSWAYWSAKKFLEVCAKANLSIEFSW